MTVDVDALQTISRAAPGLDPNIAMAIGSSGVDTGDAITAAQSTQAMGESLTSANLLKSLDPALQAKIWSGASDPQRTMISSMMGDGWVPPDQQVAQPHRNIFHRIAGAVATGIGATEHAVGAVNRFVTTGKYNPIRLAEEGAKPVINAVATAGALSQHAYRAMDAIERGTVRVDDNGQVQETPGAITAEQEAHSGYINLTAGWTKKLVSPGAWAQAWQETKHGDRTFSKADYDRITEQYQGRTVDISNDHDGSQTLPMVDVARSMATGTLEDYVSGLYPKQDQLDPQTQSQYEQFKSQSIANLMREIHGNDELKDLTQQLNNHKLSFGRMITPDSLWRDNPSLATKISGAGDAVFDIKTDPTLLAGKAYKATQVARWGVRSDEDLDKLMASGQGQRWAGFVADRLQTKDYAGLMRAMPNTAAMLPDLARKGISTPEELVKAMKLPTEDVSPENVTQWLKDNHTAGRIMIGDANMPGQGAVMAPHMSWTQEQLIKGKDKLAQKIDWAKNVGLENPDNVGSMENPGQGLSKIGPFTVQDSNWVTKPLNMLGANAKRISTLIPEGRKFDPNSPEALTYVQRFADQYLSRGAADNIVNSWASAGYETGAKREIFSNMLHQVFEAGGLYNTDKGKQLVNRWLTDSQQAMLRSSYAPGDISHMTEDGKTVAHGLTEEQLTNEWAFPSFKQLQAASQKDTFSKAVYGVSNNFTANAFNAIWKPAQLLRFGFPLRVSLDELTGGLLRNTAWDTVQARLAKPVAKVLADYAGELDDESQQFAAKEGNAQGIFSAHWAQQAKVTMAKTGKALIADKYYDAAKFGIENGFDKHFYDTISATHGAEYLGGNTDTTLELMKDGVKPVGLYFKPGEEYRGYRAGNDHYTRIWKWRLNNLANSGAARFVLDNYDDPDVIQKTAQFLRSPEFKSHWDKAARSKLLSDGRHVGEDATEEEASLDWAGKLKAMVDETLPKGEHQSPVVQHLLENRAAPELDHLEQIPDEFRPTELSGPEQVPVPFGGMGAWLKSFSDKGFHYMGKGIDAMARQPLFLHNYAEAYDQLKPIIERSIGEGPAADQALKELVAQRAIKMTTPFIHHTELRSQMNEMVSNFLPFQFAQEQFFKRWGRTLRHSPEVVRKAQLASNALTTTGMVHDDGMGNQVFTYPATGWAQKHVGDVLQMLGANVTMPVSGGFAGELKMVAPGLDRTFSPAFGPLISLPATWIGNMFPEMKPTTDALVGPITSQRKYWEQILPSSLSRTFHAIHDNASNSVSFNSAMNKTIQDVLAAKAKGGDLDKFLMEISVDDKKKQEFLDSVRNGTRTNFALRTMLGFAAPAAPTLEFGNTVFSNRMRELQKMGLDFTSAQQELLRTDPSLTPYSAYLSEGAGSEPLPATKPALEALDQHQDFFQDHPEAGGFFLPNPNNETQFDGEAYRLQLAYEMRKRRTPEEMLDHLIYNEAAPVYFDTRDEYLAENKNAPSILKQQNDAKWKDWKGQFDLLHPQFAKMRDDQHGAQKRQDTMKSLLQALDDPRAPQNPQTAAIGTLVRTYQDYLADAARLNASPMSSHIKKMERDSMTERMTNFANGFIRSDVGKDAKPVYLALMKQDLEGSQ